jgi:hypothetical protein
MSSTPLQRPASGKAGLRQSMGASSPTPALSTSPATALSPSPSSTPTPRPGRRHSTMGLATTAMFQQSPSFVASPSVGASPGGIGASAGLAAGSSGNGSNVRVICRFRPQNQIELSNGGGLCVHFSSDNKTVQIKDVCRGSLFMSFAACASFPRSCASIARQYPCVKTNPSIRRMRSSHPPRDSLKRTWRLPSPLIACFLPPRPNWKYTKMSASLLSKMCCKGTMVPFSLMAKPHLAKHSRWCVTTRPELSFFLSFFLSFS